MGRFIQSMTIGTNRLIGMIIAHDEDDVGRRRCFIIFYFAGGRRS